MQRLFSVKRIIESQLKALNPSYLLIENESWMHKKGTETHFKVVIVSEQFDNQTTLDRQRSVHSLLKSAWEEGLHSLSVIAKSPSEWKPGDDVPQSPRCLGKGK